MNEVEKIFDYSIVDDTIAQFLKVKEQELQSIVLNSSIQLGEALIEAQDKLAKYGEGTFVKWFESIGLKRQSVYNYINQCKFFHQMEKVEQIEMFQELPTTLKTEISKPSAKSEAVEMVLSGDIKTTKEYRELEKQLKAKDNQIKTQAKMIDDLQEREPQVIEREVKVVPPDYDNLKSRNKELSERFNELDSNYRQLLTERLETDEKSAKYEELSQAINQAQGKLNKTQKIVSNYKRLSDLLNQSNEFLAKASALVYQDLSEVVNSDSLANQELNFLIERTETFLKDLKNITKNDILEGEIIYE